MQRPFVASLHTFSRTRRCIAEINRGFYYKSAEGPCQTVPWLGPVFFGDVRSEAAIESERSPTVVKQSSAEATCGTGNRYSGKRGGKKEKPAFPGILPERRVFCFKLVEAAGIEPASGKVPSQGIYILSLCFESRPSIPHRQGSVGPARLILPPVLRAKSRRPSC